MVDQAPLRIPLRWMLLNMAGALLAAAAMWHLQQDGVSRWPAGIALAAGVVLMIASLRQILQRARQARPGPGK